MVDGAGRIGATRAWRDPLVLPDPCTPVPIFVIQMPIVADNKDGDPVQCRLVNGAGRKDANRTWRDPLVLPDPFTPVPILVIQMPVTVGNEDGRSGPMLVGKRERDMC